jgi:hypothetical protein
MLQLTPVFCPMRKVEANRRKALKSTDPSTPSGKVYSRRNALKHGLFIRNADKSVKCCYTKGSRVPAWCGNASGAISGAISGYVRDGSGPGILCAFASSRRLRQ